MKKIFATLLCTLLAGLCACGRTIPAERTTIATITLETTQTANTEEIATETTEASVSTVTIRTKKDDLHSYVIEEYLEAYYKILNDDNRHMLPYYYYLYDIDGNGTKELLLGVEWGGHIFLDAVYTIQNGVAVQQEAYFMDTTIGPPPLLYKNGTIRVNRVDDTIIFYYYYFRFENGELKLQIMLIDDMGRYFSNKDPMKRTPITKSEFDRVKKEMEGDGQVVELDWKPLAEYGR